MDDECASVEPDAMLAILKRNQQTVVRAIDQLNADRDRHSGSGRSFARGFASSQRAVNALNQVMRSADPTFRRILPAGPIAVIPRSHPYRVHGRNFLVETGSTDGFKIQFYTQSVLSEWFERQVPSYDTTADGPPKGVRHYTIMMLHEYGHVVHRAIFRNLADADVQRLVEALLASGNGARRRPIDCWNAFGRSFDAQSEWFSDAFVRCALRVYNPDIVL